MDASDRASRLRPRLFDVLQLTAPGEAQQRPTLPSFLYFPTPEELATSAMALPWDPEPEAIAGVLARDHGAIVPTRHVSSAKSWLSNPAIDRRAPLLPWSAEAAPKLSPVEASTRLLAHLRDAWNRSHAGEKGMALQQQDIVLTVPASFDEEARELTVAAARDAGFDELTLLEEPLAAVYAWIASHPKQLAATFADGRLLLVCDVGGGTTDFSLIRATSEGGDIAFERIAIGQHLLLGGDNVDLALTALVERKLSPASSGAPLGLTARQVLRRQCSAAKERLLGDDGPDAMPITILGAGRGLVAGTLTTDLTREETLATLNEFLPIVPADARPQRQVRGALRELGLPYESDPAVTRHLAAFLAHAARIAPQGSASDTGLIRPDAVLFNGGFFTPAIARERILDTFESWFGDRPLVLANESPDAAVAIGAAFYAGLRRDPAASARLIRAGSARSYYVAVQSAGAPGVTVAVCVMPRGTQEGTRMTLSRNFTVVTNQPAAFTLLSSDERSDALNDVVTFTPADDVHRHAPLVTAFRYGQRSRRVPLEVRLNVAYTEVGTLELWCESQSTDHRWRLQFNLREQKEDGEPSASQEAGDRADQVIVSDEAAAAAERLLEAAFRPGGGNVDSLAGELENVLGHGKHAWPLSVIRRLADVVLTVREGRRISARHEARWLNLTGFCMRPGFGTPSDAWRVGELRTVYVSGLAFPKDIQCQVEWLILWQRVAAGFTTTQQQELAQRLVGVLGLGSRGKATRINPQMLRDAWRLLASLERLDRMQRARLGDDLIARLRREAQNAAFLWAIGRFGARVPFHGPLSSVVPSSVAERWIDMLLSLKPAGDEVVSTVVQIAARTDDPVRDISPEARQHTIARLQSAGAPVDAIRAVREVVPVNPLGAARVFGETLPEGLRLEAVEPPRA